MIASNTINPKSLRHALLAKLGRNVSVIAGGTDMMVRLHDMIDRSHPRLLVMDSVKSLKRITEIKGRIIMGPLSTFDDIEKSKIIQKYAPHLADAASLAGSCQIRNRATIGGNIANGSPSGDLIPPLYSLVAVIELTSINGKREVPIEKFFKGPGKTVIKSNELITAIKFRQLISHSFFLRLATRQALAISKVSVAARINLTQNKIITGVYIALGAVAPTVIRAYETERCLISKELSEDSINSAAEMARSEARPIDDVRSTAEYRREMVGVLLKRGLMRILAQAR